MENEMVAVVYFPLLTDKLAMLHARSIERLLKVTKIICGKENLPLIK